MANISLISYKSTKNLGDAIQTIAASYFLKNIGIKNYDYVDRSNLTNTTLIYGWHRNSYEHLPKRGKFISLHSQKSILNNIDRDILVGCRDSWTASRCKIIGLKSIITGCITINIPQKLDSNFGSNILYIDSTKSVDSNITQTISENLSWEDQLSLAKDRLQLLSTASLVHTTRLHILIPCIAIGIPVVLDALPEYQPERFSFFLDHIPVNKVVEKNSGIRDNLLDIWNKTTKKILGL